VGCPKCGVDRGRAALQRRVSRGERKGASAPVIQQKIQTRHDRGITHSKNEGPGNRWDFGWRSASALRLKPPTSTTCIPTEAGPCVSRRGRSGGICCSHFVAMDRVERTLLSAAFDLDFVRSVGCPNVGRPWKSGASAPRKPWKEERGFSPS